MKLSVWRWLELKKRPNLRLLWHYLLIRSVEPCNYTSKWRRLPQIDFLLRFHLLVFFLPHILFFTRFQLAAVERKVSEQLWWSTLFVSYRITSYNDDYFCRSFPISRFFANLITLLWMSKHWDGCRYLFGG